MRILKQPYGEACVKNLSFPATVSKTLGSPDNSCEREPSRVQTLQPQVSLQVTAAWQQPHDRPGDGTASEASLGFLILRNHETTNCFSFKPLSFGAICYQQEVMNAVTI